MSLRKHQSQFNAAISGICSGSGVKTIYAHCTPGGGKSILPIIAGKLVPTHADRICWIAPRLSLIDQAEREFVNPYFRQILGHRLTIRSSTNEVNPCRGFQGFATTYNAVGLDDGLLVDEFSRHQYILVLDEFHHVAEGSEWEKKIRPLWDRAAFRIPMTGTLERGEGNKIAFLPYGLNGSGMSPNLQETEDTAVIRYTRADALAEKAIIPLAFHLRDSETTWQTRRGREVKMRSFDRARTDQDISRSLYTALTTEFSEALLQDGIEHWLRERSAKPGLKALVVCSNISEAKRHTAALGQIGWRNIKFGIATSEDSPEALKAIKDMKAGKLDLLVTVAMAYEGLDIPAVSHIICLTRIRSTPWIEQMTARANRIDPMAGPYETQMGHIFAPADPLFREIVARIEKEQLPFISQAGGRERQTSPVSSGEVPWLTSPGGIVPISSAMTRHEKIEMGTNYPLFENIETPSETEARLRDQIETHVRLYSFKNRFKVQEINRRIMSYFDYQPRDEMDLGTLGKVLDYCLLKLPLNQARGTGYRVPIKAEPFKCEWRE